ncbi:SDR family oxidoreductase [Aliifodinibius salicampi]|uniref:SDR family oxidoreductase n=1 Tax=Fodinibius salicampi TaxID=1920655 RepID=A0ABT3PU91_9BACT|nr:SDR family oxidoreductase [Fodinibius salicampi]MCW9711412.1 SDR family oxidoreductase [Fodinibius salicampi]
MKNKVALITGAATGIGRETAIAFARKGANVVISDINDEKLKETQKLIEEKRVKVLSVKADISKEDDIRNMVKKAVEQFGRLDIACNNAGIAGESATTGEYSIEGWDKVLNVNLRGQFICMKYEIEAMIKNGSGSIVNISSILGHVGFAEAPAYVASKHGLLGLTKTAAIEYASQGIRINAVCPGFIETPMLEDAGITTVEETKQYIISLHPAGRLGKPREVADAIVWLASDEASFVTGHPLLVDGGYVAW